jgi:hypothetical protein
VKNFVVASLVGGRAAVMSGPLLIVLLALLSTTAAAQAGTESTDDVPVLDGRVVYDGSGVPNVPVALHRITPTESGEIAATTTDDDGRFTFPLEPIPGASFTVYFATTEYLSVRFFGNPLHPDSASAIEYLLPVYDTTSTLIEPIRFASRDMFMEPDLLGGWEVLEILRISNPTSMAYVGTGGLGPWEFRLPEGATDFQVGQADVLPHELSWVDDRVLHLTPVTPGTREAFISYRLPRGPATSTLRVGEPTDTLNLYVREDSHLSSIAGLQTTRSINADGQNYIQYSGLALEPGAAVTLTWTRPEGPPVDPRLAAVLITVVLLGIGLVASMRNRGRPA